MSWNVSDTLARYGHDIGERTFAYALRAVSLYRHLESCTSEGSEILARQFLRSATSVGANIEEAQCAESRADFIHKMRIAQKEIRECRYWLRLLRESGMLEQNRSDALYHETDELLRILSKIIINTRDNSKGNIKNSKK